MLERIVEREAAENRAQECPGRCDTLVIGHTELAMNLLREMYINPDALSLKP
jgi:hypothetical protein